MADQNRDRAPRWDLKPGDEIERKELQKKYGGRTQGGIGPSTKSPNVFLFSDPVAGEPHGYFDGWWDDGCFHYTGEGQYGDQQMKSGNAAVLNNEEDGRALRLFMGARGVVTYEDEFELDPKQPYYYTEAHETGFGRTRIVIVFRLRPKTVTPRPSNLGIGALLKKPVEEVPIEQQWTERVFVAPSLEPYEAERREQKLVQALKEHLRRKQHRVSRLKIVPPGEWKPLFCDLVDHDTGLLVEAKGSAKRDAIRMAIGQLADYRRFLSPAPKRLAVLVPSQPRKDLGDLLAAEQIDVIWPSEDGFGGTVDGLLD